MARFWTATLGLLPIAGVAVAAQNSTDFQQRNYNTIKAIYDLTLYPNNLAFLKNGSKSLPPNLFNEKATGRITPIGNFSGFEDSVEYFFGLTPPALPPLYDTWTKAEITHFSSGCPEVASSVVYGTTTGVNASVSTFGKQVTTIKQVAFWRFDEQGAVLDYEAWLPTLEQYTELLYGTTRNPEVNKASIAQLCTQTQSLCTGSNQQYSSVDSCMQTLSSIPYGTFDEVWGNNVVCRTLHVILAKLRPDVHCMHVGPTGGGKCVDIQYNDVYFDDLALFGAPSGGTFMCPGIQK